MAHDRIWSVYALGDLEPGLFEHTCWYAAEGSAALLMLFTAFDTPVLFAAGPADRVAGLLDEIGDRPRLYLSIQPEILPLIRARYAVSGLRAMWRMALDPGRFQPWPGSPAGPARLTPSDYTALTRLYADGAATGEAPDFFAPYMVEQGVFYGIFEGQELVAAAGTHLVAPAEGVAAVGNVYTRRDRRGRGLATRVTSAVASELVRGLPAGSVIALNVMQANRPALSVYERLGFARHCEFYEGLAERRSAPDQQQPALV